MTIAILKTRPAAAPGTPDPRRETADIPRLLGLDHSAWQRGARWRDRTPAGARPRLVCRWHQDTRGRLFCAWESDD
jgi:hypothetical protein